MIELVDTKIRDDIVTEQIVCAWLMEGDDSSLFNYEDEASFSDYEVLFSDYDLGSALEYDIFLRRCNG
jgi:hypothetical protein